MRKMWLIFMVFAVVFYTWAPSSGWGQQPKIKRKISNVDACGHNIIAVREQIGMACTTNEGKQGTFNQLCTKYGPSTPGSGGFGNGPCVCWQAVCQEPNKIR